MGVARRPISKIIIRGFVACRVYEIGKHEIVPPQCHGCGRNLPADKLKKCTRCKRVHYCGRACQAIDWAKPRYHKRSCQPNLLEVAMSNLPQLTFEDKIQMMFEVPNSDVNQTINKVSCDSVEDLLTAAGKEVERIKKLSMMTDKEIQATRGDARHEHVSYRHGLDDGIETLCLALNQWPGVATVASCSGLHFRPTMASSPDHYAVYVCDDPEISLKINNIIASGALGIKFDVTTLPQRDKVGGVPGFAAIDYIADGEVKSAGLCVDR